jgi:hypothetical protein
MKQNEKEREEEMEQILGEHRVIFAKPKELPPPRTHDHHIIFVERIWTGQCKTISIPILSEN